MGQTKKSSHWRKILVHSLSPAKMFKVVLPALVSLNLAQAQLFGPQPARPTFSRNNDQIVDQVLDQLSPSIAQAVAEALRGLNDNRQASGPPSPPRPVESKASPAQYKFEYKIAIIRQVLAALQPAIRESVQSAISG